MARSHADPPPSTSPRATETASLLTVTTLEDGARVGTLELRVDDDRRVSVLMRGRTDADCGPVIATLERRHLVALLALVDA